MFQAVLAVWYTLLCRITKERGGSELMGGWEEENVNPLESSVLALVEEDRIQGGVT